MSVSLAVETTLRTHSELLVAGRLWGDHSPARLLAVHGWLDNCESFTPLFAAWPGPLSALAIDLPGHGRSQHHRHQDFYHFAEGTLALASLLGPDKVTLIGHSLGGSLGLALAASFPEKIEKLVLLDSLGPLASSAEETATRLRQSWESLQELTAKKTPIYQTLAQAAEARRRASGISETSARLLAERGTRVAEGGGVTWSTDPKLRLVSPFRYSESQVHSLIASVQCPVLLVEAETGILKDFSDRDSRLAQFKHLTHLVVAGHHHVHMDAPHTLLPAIKDFLGA